MRKSNILFSIVFLVIIFGFFFIDIFTPDLKFSYSENRTLQQKPELTWETIKDGSFMEDMEVYVNDQIKFRDEFVKISTYFKLALGQNEINDVYICDDYLIEKFVDKDIDTDLLNSNIDSVNKFLSKYPNSHIGLIPTSTEILDYKLSNYATNVNQLELINKIYGSNQSIDIYSELLKHNQEDIYYRTDHHWTSLGAYYGYVAICKELGITPMELSEFDISTIDAKFSGTIQSKVNLDFGFDVLHKYSPNSFSPTYTRVVDEMYQQSSDSLYDESKLTTKEKYAVYIGGNSAITRIFTENGKEDRGRLLLIKDSFSHSLAPFLANHFSEIVLLDLRYYWRSVDMFLKSDKESFDNMIVLYNLKNFVSDKNLIRVGK
jgi:hypothetical protein